MRNRKKWLLGGLLLVFSLFAGGLWLTEETWAWPVVSERNRGQLTMGTVDCRIQVLQNDLDVSVEEALSAGSYLVKIDSTGDSEGWFLLRLSSPEDGSVAGDYRTELLKPAESMSFVLQLAETVVLTVEPRWDKPYEGLTVLFDGEEVLWGSKPADETAGEETETTEPPATEATATATEPPATEATATATEPPATEATAAATEVPATSEAAA